MKLKWGLSLFPSEVKYLSDKVIKKPPLSLKYKGIFVTRIRLGDFFVKWVSLKFSYVNVQ